MLVVFWIGAGWLGASALLAWAWSRFRRPLRDDRV